MAGPRRTGIRLFQAPPAPADGLPTRRSSRRLAAAMVIEDIRLSVVHPAHMRLYQRRPPSTFGIRLVSGHRVFVPGPFSDYLHSWQQRSRFGA